MARYFHYTEPVPRTGADGQVVAVYDQIRADFGLLAEPFTLHSPAPPILAGAWAILRETLVVGRRPRGEKETIAVAVSESNRCPWCLDAHTAMLHATGVHGSGDPILRGLAAWAAACGAQPDALPAPFVPQDGPELAGTALVFHYLNRMVTLFLAERIMPANPALRGSLQRIGGWLFARQAARSLPPGASAALLPTASPPPDLAWLASRPPIATAFGQMVRAVEEEAGPHLSPAARCLLCEHLAAWMGESMPLSRRWAEPVLAPLDETDRAAAHLALLAALAPHQVGEATVESFRRQHPSDRALVAVAAWGSLAAARRIGQWVMGGVAVDGRTEPATP